MPSGRDIHIASPYILPTLDADILARMRAPPEPSESATAARNGDSSSDESIEANNAIPGAFPGQPPTNPDRGDYY